jgi:hypothetical protein
VEARLLPESYDQLVLLLLLLPVVLPDYIATLCNKLD